MNLAGSFLCFLVGCIVGWQGMIHVRSFDLRRTSPDVPRSTGALAVSLGAPARENAGEPHRDHEPSALPWMHYRDIHRVQGTRIDAPWIEGGSLSEAFILVLHPTAGEIAEIAACFTQADESLHHLGLERQGLETLGPLQVALVIPPLGQDGADVADALTGNIRKILGHDRFEVLRSFVGFDEQMERRFGYFGRLQQTISIDAGSTPPTADIFYSRTSKGVVTDPFGNVTEMEYVSMLAPMRTRLQLDPKRAVELIGGDGWRALPAEVREAISRGDAGKEDGR